MMEKTAKRPAANEVLMGLKWETLPEDELILLVQKGSGEAFVELASRYLPLIHRMASPYRSSFLEAEDQTGEKSGGIRLTCGYDEISESSIRITKERGEGTGTAVLSRGRGIVSIHKMKGKFCDTCIQKILETVKGEAVGEAVIYDAVDKSFYPVAEGERQIGDYIFQTAYKQGNYEIQIEYMR